MKEENKMPLTEKKKASNKKWDSENYETITIKYNKKFFSKEQIKAAAAREGYPTVNSYLVELIKNSI